MNGAAGRSFYEVLGVHPHAQIQEIKNAYRMLALRYHPDKNQGDPSAKVLFQEIQAAYETLSDNDKRAKYDSTTGLRRSNHSTRTWREPSYEPCYTRDPPFWSVELREMTVQKCARIAKIQHLERKIRDLVTDLNDLVDAEKVAVSKEKKALSRFSSIILRSPKINAQRHQDFLGKSAYINSRLNWVKSELRSAHEDHRTLLEKDNKRKTWWARERVRRVEEENRRAATTAAEAARRRNEKRRERECGKSDWEAEATRAAEEIRQWAREEGLRRAREARAEEEAKIRAERVREDPEGARRAEREAQEWFVLLQPIMPLFKPIGSLETLSRNFRSPPESINSDVEKYNRLARQREG